MLIQVTQPDEPAEEDKSMKNEKKKGRNKERNERASFPNVTFVSNIGTMPDPLDLLSLLLIAVFFCLFVFINCVVKHVVSSFPPQNTNPWNFDSTTIHPFIDPSSK